MTTSKHLLLGLAGILMVAILVGCIRGVSVDTTRHLTEADVRVLPYSNGKKIVAGKAFSVTLELTPTSEGFELATKVDGTVEGKEIYLLDDKALSASAIYDAEFKPALPIMFLAVDPNQHIAWSGTMSGQTASGEVVLSSEVLNLPGGPYHCIRSSATLEIESKEKPVKRNLTFWIAPGKGVVSAQFGALSSREPAE